MCLIYIYIPAILAEMGREAEEGREGPRLEVLVAGGSCRQMNRNRHTCGDTSCQGENLCCLITSDLNLKASREGSK